MADILIQLKIVMDGIMKVKVKIWYPYWVRHEAIAEIEIPDGEDPEFIPVLQQSDKLDLIRRISHIYSDSNCDLSDNELNSAIDVGYAGVKIIGKEEE